MEISIPVPKKYNLFLKETFLFLIKNNSNIAKLKNANIILLKTSGIDCIFINSPKIPVNPQTNIIMCNTIKLCFLDSFIYSFI